MIEEDVRLRLTHLTEIIYQELKEVVASNKMSRVLECATDLPRLEGLIILADHILQEGDNES